MTNRVSLTYKSANVRDDIFKIKLFVLLLTLSWRTAPHLTAYAVNRLFFKPSSNPLTSNQKHLLAKGRPFCVRVNKKTIRCWSWGTGPAILFVHGWNGRALQYGGFIRETISRGCRAIAFDAPAHGFSDGKTANYFEFSDAAEALLKQTGSAVKAIVGHSLGASAAINALYRRKQKIKTVLICPALKLEKMLLSAFRRYDISEKIYQRLIAQYENRYGYSLNRHDPFKIIQTMRFPILVIHDQNDTSIAFEETRQAVIINDHISLFATQGLGHTRILKNARVIKLALDHIVKKTI
ncbi:MAG: alpha/beta fold hydrolase [Desulfobacteraceae bacterium]|nr:alpha/beta fold hydrolase [Desulfobacteraceae bacterium]